MRPVSVGGKSGCQVESCFARRDGIQHGRSSNAAQHLRDDVRRQFRNRKSLLTTNPTETAGFKWHPEMWPIANAMVRTVRPKARATPAKPIPRPGKAAASTALPHPPKTSQKVPINSANALFDRGIQKSSPSSVDYTPHNTTFPRRESNGWMTAYPEVIVTTLLRRLLRGALSMEFKPVSVLLD